MCQHMSRCDKLQQPCMQGCRLTQSDAQCAVNHIEHSPMEDPGEHRRQELQVEHVGLGDMCTGNPLDT